ncbi:hypothetical protein PV797_18825 [Clostridiaceae bacterium M8S5]|nr:hypothetical protein PV797_18825 [Clostridiaceae bacterium M8S5]
MNNVNTGLINKEDFNIIEQRDCLRKEDLFEVEVVDVSFSYGEHRIRK